MDSLCSLQTAIASLSAERAYIQQLIRQYDQLLNVHVGDLIAKISEVQEQIARRQRGTSRRRSEQDAAIPWVPPRGSQAASAALDMDGKVPAPESETSLKKLYRQAVALAHPDLFAGKPAHEARANEIMGQLNAAYEGEDLETVRQLLSDLHDGLPFWGLDGQEPDPATSERILIRLTEERDTLQREVTTLRKSDGYRLMTDPMIDLHRHFAQLEQRCRTQLDYLNQQLHTP